MEKKKVEMFSKKKVNYTYLVKFSNLWVRATERHTSYEESGHKRKSRYPWWTNDHVSLLSTFKTLSFACSDFHTTLISPLTFQRNHAAVWFLHSWGCAWSTVPSDMSQAGRIGPRLKRAKAKGAGSVPLICPDREGKGERDCLAFYI